MTATFPTRAYNIEMLKQLVDRSRPENKGWVFGLPPGITPQQWPLDPNTGYPLMHGFTILLPDEYRCHGPRIVALSFFAVSADHNDGGTATTEEIFEILKDATPARPDDPKLLIFWQSVHARADARETSLSELVNALLKKDIELIESGR